MALQHYVHRAKHRRRRRAWQIGLAVLATTVVAAGVTVAVVLEQRSGAGPAAQGRADLTHPPAGRTQSSSAAGTSTTTTSASSGTVVPVASLAVPTMGDSVSVGGTPLFACLTPDGRAVWVADPGTGQIDVLDTASGSLSARFRIPEGPPHLLTFSPDGRLAYLGVYDDQYHVHVVDVVDTATHAVVRTIPVGAGPYALGIPPGGRLLYVPLYAEAHMDVVDPATGAMRAELPMAADPHWIAFRPDGRTGYVTDHFSDVVSVVNLTRNTVVRTIPVGDGPHSIAMSPDGSHAAVVNYIAGSLTVIDTASDAVVATVPDVGVKPQHVVYAPDGRHLYTANSGDQTVSVVDTATNAVTAGSAPAPAPPASPS